MRDTTTDTVQSRFPRLAAAFGGGGIIGTLGGLIGLGGAEFRLPLLIGGFRFAALEAVILNKAMSLVVVATALPFRMTTVPLSDVAAHWPIIVNLLVGSLAGAWFGAGWATRLKSETLYRIIAVLLVVIAGVLLFGHDPNAAGQPLMTGALQAAVGVVAGFAIGVVASLMGVAGGELLIPTIILLFGADVKLAGSLSLAVSLPTMIAGFARYSRDQTFTVVGRNRTFLLVMASGSIIGAFIGAQLVGVIPSTVLLPGLALILLFSAAKVWGHK
ncbi:MAG: sulfite exporter TauE/SafE family protein [Hyphomonadaceae bacterium]